jgi:hypothetical protein
MNTYKLISFFFSILLFLGLTNISNAMTLDFETGANGVAIGSDFSSDGIVFTNAYYASSPYDSTNGSAVWVSGEQYSGYNDVGNVAITGYFIDPVSYLSAELIYVDGGTIAYLTAYDIDGIILDSTSIDWYTISELPAIISINHPGIAQFAFTWTGGGSPGPTPPIDDVVGIDNLTFNTTPAPEPVSIDIKPNSCPNPLNIDSKGVLTVAVHGTPDFDTTTIDTASVRLEGVAPIRSSIEDVVTPVLDPQSDCECNSDRADGYDDLIFKFSSSDVGDVLGDVQPGDVVELILTGNLNDGTPIEGFDCIICVGKRNKD